MASVAELYTLYLKPYHLPPDGCNVTITAYSVEDLHSQPGSEKTERKIVLSFKNATRRMAVNQTQANRLADLCGEDYTTWPGQTIRLTPADLNKKTQTIVVGPARAKNPHP